MPGSIAAMICRGRMIARVSRVMVGECYARLDCGDDMPRAHDSPNARVMVGECYARLVCGDDMPWR